MLLPSVAVNNFPLPVSSGLFYLPASSTMSEGLDGLVMSYSTLDIASETNGKSANENQLVGKITAMEGLSVDEVVALIVVCGRYGVTAMRTTRATLPREQIRDIRYTWTASFWSSYTFPTR